MLTFLLALALTWTIVACILAGVGSLILRGACGEDAAATDFVERFWAGFSGSTALLILWSLFAPIDGKPGLVLGLAGIIGWLLERRNAAALLARAKLLDPLQAAAFLGFALVVAFGAAGTCAHYDTGMYGAQTMRWASTYPAVPGLANLVQQFGFNSSAHLWFAALERGYWHGRSQHLLLPLLAVMLGGWAAPAFVRLVLNRSSDRFSDWLKAISLLSILPFAVNGRLIGMDTDLGPMLLGVSAACIIARCLRKVPLGLESAGPHLVSASLMLTALISMKLSAVVFAGTTLLILAVFTLGHPQVLSLRAKTFIVGAIASILVPWLARGAILSGYPLYPSRLISLPVPWASPRFADDQRLYVRSYSRNPLAPAEATTGWGWIPRWFTNGIKLDKAGFAVPLCYIAASLAALALQLGSKRKRSVFRSEFAWPVVATLLPSFAGLVFWFITAPAGRFAQFEYWTIIVVGASVALCLSSNSAHLLQRSALVLAALLALWLNKALCDRASLLLKFNDPAEILAKPAMKRATLASGLTVFVPIPKDKFDDYVLWDAPLPSAAIPDPSLRLRVPGNLAAGFVLDNP
jgi:hypothetical protein